MLSDPIPVAPPAPASAAAGAIVATPPPFAGQTALVTGASRGIGRAIALELAAGGANIAFLYAGNQTAADETLALLAQTSQGAAHSATAQAYQCDIASFAATKAVVAAILADFGRVDILINNAGITRDGLVLNMSEESFDAVVDTNLKGAFNMIRHLYSPMMKQRYGRIINISSIAGIAGNAGQANYASAKAGLIGLTKSIARELGGRCVTCNAVAPGFIRSDMTDQLPEKIREQAMAAIPLKRMGQPEEVAKLTAFLASPQAAYITGTVIQIDGGLHL